MQIITIQRDNEHPVRILSIGGNCHYAIRGDLQRDHQATPDFHDIGELAAAIVTDTVIWIDCTAPDEEKRS